MATVGGSLGAIGATSSVRACGLSTRASRAADTSFVIRKGNASSPNENPIEKGEGPPNGGPTRVSGGKAAPLLGAQRMSTMTLHRRCAVPNVAGPGLIVNPPSLGGDCSALLQVAGDFDPGIAHALESSVEALINLHGKPKSSAYGL